MRIIGNKNIYFSERKERQCPPFSHSEWIKFAIFALIVRPKKKKLQMSKHITEEQRYAISMMLQIPMSKKAIAEAIGVDKSTVYREIKRNCDARSGSYSMELAQRKADRRKQQKHRKEVLTPAMRKRIIKLLKKGFSPEQRLSAGAAWRELRWYLTKRYIAGFGRISGGVANCTNIFADKVAGMPNVVLKMQGEDLSQAGWILMSVPR